MTLVEYMERRLGTRRGRLMAWRMFAWPFAAATPREFWKTWNPVYGYALGHFVYRPLRRILPAGPAIVATFAFSGFALHDLLAWPTWIVLTGRPPFPFVTVAFVVFALLALGADTLGMSFAKFSPLARCIAHMTWIALGFGIADIIARAL